MTKPKVLALLALPALLAGCASPTFGDKGPGDTRMTKAGPVLVDADGMTLYVYDKDKPRTSSCTGLCAVVWPPAVAKKNAQPHDGFTVIVREDGSRQWTYKGRPLYGYVGDSKPGDISGDNDDGVWHAAHQ